jgi:hypothetical protein
LPRRRCLQGRRPNPKKFAERRMRTDRVSVYPNGRYRDAPRAPPIQMRSVGVSNWLLHTGQFCPLQVAAVRLGTY